ncbi:MAG: sulfurtransferase [Cereibacter sphaeroides]|uniref:Sulfurtransferase n=1 Tax=Cereibacter sphaeroides TaxID=1063 RepID=A0A2W5SJC1_CERSP|nr:MAG: sulfurtransferase [Cereibacter sphaeroides]
MPAFNSISADRLMRLIGMPDVPALLDVRLPEDIATDPFLLPGARLMPHGDVESAAPALSGKRAIVICRSGKKLSEGAAALLRLNGVEAEILEGGSETWAAAGMPRVPIGIIPAGSLWVTRHRPKIDRIACPWLIRRFVDPSARFLFVSPPEVQAVADRFGAEPFDVEGVFWSHRGDKCTFDTMVSEFGLSTPAMDRLATLVRAADTDRHDLAPQAAGLLAISVGLSRLYRNDLDQLEAGIHLYDALYRWARDGFEEGHDWPGNR